MNDRLPIVACPCGTERGWTDVGERGDGVVQQRQPLGRPYPPRLLFGPSSTRDRRVVRGVLPALLEIRDGGVPVVAHVPAAVGRQDLAGAIAVGGVRRVDGHERRPALGVGYVLHGSCLLLTR